MMDYLWATTLVAGVLLCWVLNVLAVPGSNWFMIGFAALYVWQGPQAGRLEMGWTPVGVLVGLAALGELVEFIAGAAGVQKVGGSRRSAVLAIVGSLLGGVFGMFVALPIPVIGPLVGAILFAGAGALGGALLGERWKGRQWPETWQVGKAAFWGRLFGTLGKILFASVMVAVVVIALIV